MFSKTSKYSRRRFLERSALGAGGALFLPGLLASCTDHQIPPLEESPKTGTPVGIPMRKVVFTATNHTSNQPFILLAAPPSDANPTAQYYERSPTAAQPPGGGAAVVWNPGETKQCEFVIQDGLQLIIATSDYLFPIRVLVAQDQYNKQTYSYDPIVVTDDDPMNVQAMKVAERFYMTVKTFPHANMAIGYRDLIATLTDSSLSTANIDQASYDYFTNLYQYDGAYSVYEQVNLTQLAVITSYHHHYPYVWTDYQPSRIHYLYSSDGTSVTYRGSVAINLGFRVANQPFWYYAITFTDEHNYTKPLYYDDGFFVDDLYADNPGVCLVGNFVQKSQLTNFEYDTEIVPTPIGVVSGYTVVGTDQKPVEQHSWFYLLTHPQTAMDWMNIIILMCGAIMGLDEFLLAAIGLYVEFTQDNDTSRDQSQSDGTLAQYIEQANQDRVARLAKHQNTPIPVNTSLEAVAAAVAAAPPR